MKKQKQPEEQVIFKCKTCAMSCVCKKCSVHETCIISSSLHCYPLRTCTAMNKGYAKTLDAMGEIIFNNK